MKRLTPLAAVVLCAVTLGGCTLVPTDSTPRSVSPKAVPSGLLNGGGTRTTSDETLWFLSAAGLPVARTERLATPVTVASVVRSLARPPRGLSTAVPAAMQIDRAVITGTTATVIVHQGLGSLHATEQTTLMGQIVRTLRGLFGVSTLVLTDQSDGTELTLDAPLN